MNKQYKIGDEVLVRGVVNSEVRNGGIHVLHDGVDAFYMIYQIHEPQTVVVPAFIDSYIRYAKNEGMSLFIAMDNAQNKESEWIITNEETFTRAWLDGYVVEKERRYTVEIPDPNRKGTNRIYLGKSDPNGKVFIHKGNFNAKKKKKLMAHRRRNQERLCLGLAVCEGGGVMKPKKYPYSGKTKIVRKELPRFIKLGKIALKSELIEHIEAIAFAGNYQTRLVLKIPRFFNHEEKVIMVQLNIDNVVKILNQYK